jgi:NADH-quinone oxidoreductase subunit N
MELLTFLDNSCFFNVSIYVISIYLLISLYYGVFLSSIDNLGLPNLLNSFNLFSFFFLSSVLFLFGFDFQFIDSLYFFNQSFQLFFLLIVILALFVSRDFLIKRNVNKYEYDILFLFVVLSSVCLCFADDFLILYLSIELLSLSFYVFATFHRNSEFATESGLKYFVFGGVISCFLLLGFSIIYLAFGSTDFEMLFSLACNNDDNFLFLGVLFILVALLFKVGSAPFHS